MPSQSGGLLSITTALDMFCHCKLPVEGCAGVVDPANPARHPAQAFFKTVGLQHMITVNRNNKAIN